MSMVTSAYYGIAQEPVQPTGMSTPQPAPQAATPIATTPVPGRVGVFAQPSFWLVFLLALAVGLIHLSIRFS
ncbi:MAG: hypothetical protein FWC87_01115 [Acidimicrobiaceae bacterium]|nr:hypothetical protein [Acidimicrobiaceae bacterium]